MMNHARFTKSSTSPKISETLGNILKATFLILHGVLPNIRQLLEKPKMSSHESSSPMILILKVIKRQEKDGSKASIFTTLMTSLRPRRMPLMLETVL